MSDDWLHGLSDGGIGMLWGAQILPDAAAMLKYPVPVLNIAGDFIFHLSHSMIFQIDCFYPNNPTTSPCILTLSKLYHGESHVVGFYTHTLCSNVALLF